jgi:hypothetical protein
MLDHLMKKIADADITCLGKINDENDLVKNSLLSGLKTVEETRKLIEEGFEYITEVDGAKLFRKRE